MLKKQYGDFILKIIRSTSIISKIIRLIANKIKRINRHMFTKF